jgi:hypothetical protein
MVVYEKKLATGIPTSNEVNFVLPAEVIAKQQNLMVWCQRYEVRAVNAAIFDLPSPAKHAVCGAAMIAFVGVNERTQQAESYHDCSGNQQSLRKREGVCSR